MDTTTQQREFFGHPPGLAVLFMTEMWERFSFYGMRVLLIFYLTKHFLYSDEVSSGIYGAYLGLTYALPVLGGYFADKYIGARKAVLYGGILLVLGHTAMAFEGGVATIDSAGTIMRDEFSADVMFLALALICVGVGMLKPNISTLVGSLYEQNDTRRDAGFTIFYMGINVGAFLATLIVGTVGEQYGWRYGFGMAGIGMLFGLVVFIYGQKYLGTAGDAPEMPTDTRKVAIGNWTLPMHEVAIYVGSLFMVGICWYLVQDEHTVGLLLFLAVISAYSYIIFQCWRNLSTDEFKRVMAVLILIFFTVAFWAMFEQAGSSMNLFADRVVNRHSDFLDYEFAASIFQSVNPGVIILLGPVFAYLWYYLAKRGIELGYAVKFSIGIIFAGLGFGCLVLGALTVGDNGKVAALWLVLAYVLHTFGELCLSPVGLSMVSKLAPASMVGMMMGTWFLASSIADWLSAQIAKLAAIDRSVLEQGNVGQQLDIYTSLFTTLTIAGVGIGLILMLISPFINKLANAGSS